MHTNTHSHTRKTQCTPSVIKLTSGCFFSTAYMSSDVKMMHKLDVCGHFIYNSYAFLTWQDVFFASYAHTSCRKEGLFLKPLPSALFCLPLPSWFRKFLTLQSPLPSLYFRDIHFSQLVRVVWHHLGFNRVPIPQLRLDNESSTSSFLCVWSYYQAILLHFLISEEKQKEMIFCHISNQHIRLLMTFFISLDFILFVL